MASGSSPPLHEYDDFGEDYAAGTETSLILELRESLREREEECKDYQEKWKTAEQEFQKWRSAFKENLLPSDPSLVIGEFQNLKVSEKSLKEELEKARQKEAAFLVRFAKRDREVAELKSHILDLKSQLTPRSLRTQRLLLDPAIHEEFIRMKNALEDKDKKIKALEEDLAALSFTSDSKIGQMLIAKCRTLQEENEELSMMASEGKIHELQMRLSLQKHQNRESQQQIQDLLHHIQRRNEGVEDTHEPLGALKKEVEYKDNEIQRMRESRTHKAAVRDKKKKRKEERNAADG